MGTYGWGDGLIRDSDVEASFKFKELRGGGFYLDLVSISDNQLVDHQAMVRQSI